MSVICVTGHRPDKVGGYDKKVEDKLYLTAKTSLELLSPQTVITGMALGWDQAIAQACVDMDIPFVAAIPFTGQEAAWPKESQEKYRALINKAFHIHVDSPPPYRPYKMQKRNEWMVDHSKRCLALWNTEPGGGTYGCIRYAMVCGKPVLNAWDIFSRGENVLSPINKL